MKLKEFNSENTLSTRGGGSKIPGVSINQKSGTFSINLEACTLIDLKENDQVVIHQDEEDQENWYLEKVKEKGFTCRNQKALGKGLVFNNTSLVRSICASVEHEENGGRILIAGKPTMVEKRKLWGLIVTSLKKLKIK